MIRLNRLRDFVDIVDAGSIRAAARRRRVSQPVLTKALQGLESEIGARLLQRTSQGVLLTPSGRVLLVRARAIQAQVAKAQQEIAEIAGQRGGSVAFGASAAGLHLVPQALERLRAEFPRSYVRVVEGAPRALLPLLRDESLDFFLGPRAAGAVDAQVKVRPLFRLPLTVAGRRDHPMRGARSLAELREAPWLLFSAGGWSDSLVGSSFRAAGLAEPPCVTQCESYSTAIALLSETDTLGLIPRPHLAQRRLRELVREIRIDDPLPELAFALYVRANDALTRPAAALVRAFLATARGMMAGRRLPDP